jgi:hypothetical protein
MVQTEITGLARSLGLGRSSTYGRECPYVCYPFSRRDSGCWECEPQPAGGEAMQKVMGDSMSLVQGL